MSLETAKKILKLNQNSYSQIAEKFSDSRYFSWAEIDETIKKYVRQDDKILDLGCGSGRLLKSLLKIITPASNAALVPFSYLGLDNCSALIEKAQASFLTNRPVFLSSLPFCHPELACPASAADSGSRNINFIIGDILNLDQFQDNKFDIVFMIASFHHIPSQELREKLLQDIKRVLKPNGLLIMTNWNLWQINAKKSVWHYQRCLQSPDWRHNALTLQSGDWSEQKNFGLRLTDYKDILTLWQNQFPLYYHAFTLREVKKLLQKTGFKILENYYVKHGQKIHWWNGHNILTVAQKIIKQN